MHQPKRLAFMVGLVCCKNHEFPSKAPFDSVGVVLSLLSKSATRSITASNGGACVRPGGESLLRLTGWPKVQQVLRATDAIDALGIDSADVAQDYWRHVHNRIAAGQTPRDYTVARHAAWIKRRRAGQ